ncbi:hypothetical protein C8F01DRAFT_1084381 [Mycena amicta]|nr:hypothetical protein C8F01DRAFT_1084381 [Mycena amicta]
MPHPKPDPQAGGTVRCLRGRVAISGSSKSVISHHADLKLDPQSDLQAAFTNRNSSGYKCSWTTAQPRQELSSSLASGCISFPCVPRPGCPHLHLTNRVVDLYYLLGQVNGAQGFVLGVLLSTTLNLAFTVGNLNHVPSLRSSSGGAFLLTRTLILLPLVIGEDNNLLQRPLLPTRSGTRRGTDTSGGMHWSGHGHGHGSGQGRGHRHRHGSDRSRRGINIEDQVKSVLAVLGIWEEHIKGELGIVHLVWETSIPHELEILVFVDALKTTDWLQSPCRTTSTRRHIVEHTIDNDELVPRLLCHLHGVPLTLVANRAFRCVERVVRLDPGVKLVSCFAGRSLKSVTTAEEANMAEKIRAAVALERQSKGKTTSTDNGDSARGTDVDANRQDLCGFPILGWERAIQKVIGNAVDAAKDRALKKAKPSVASGVHSGASSLSSADAMRILDLMEYTPRAKFTTDKHEEILALARTYTGGNPGANFNRAAKALWAQADQDQWAAATEAELAAIPPAERMALLKSAFCTALSKIQDSGCFPSFVATLQLGYHDEDYNRMVFEVGEVFPLDSEVVPGFQLTREIECESYLGHLHAWAAVPLKGMMNALAFFRF